MNTILEQYADKINSTFSFFDRMIIKGHIFQFFSSSGKKYFLSKQNILLKDFSAYASQVTDELVSSVENMTSAHGHSLIYLTSAKSSKEATALSTVNRKCKYYYFYYLDRNFGFIHVKLQT